MVSEIKTFDARKEALVKLGSAKGYVTYEELANELKGLDIDADSLDDLYNVLLENKIEIKSEDEEENNVDGEVVESPDKILEDLSNSKDIKINDPVRMYLKEIGRINCLLAKKNLNMLD